MKSPRRPRPRQVRRLGAAAACALSSTATFAALLGGVVFDATRGATIGLFATIALLFVAFLLALAAVGLTLQALVTARHRRLDNVIEVAPASEAPRERAA